MDPPVRVTRYCSSNGRTFLLGYLGRIIVFMSARNYQNNLLARISSGISAKAANLQLLDLTQLGRRAEAACQFQNLLADIKHQIARKSAVRAQMPLAIEALAVHSLAA